MFTAGGNVNWWSHCGKHYGDSPKKLKTELLYVYDPVIPFLSVYPRQTKTVTQKDTCTPLFTAALFTKPRHGSHQSVYHWMNR